jgi:DNA (cytosine-5)-methyltransferase 1
VRSVSEFSRLRTSAGISIDDFADAAGFSRSTVYRWERGITPPRRAAVRMLDDMLRRNRIPAAPAAVENTGTFTFIDLFAGIGGLRRGFEPFGGRCVFTSEWDKHSQLTYRANNECDHEVAGDITKVPLADIPAHDVLLAGFPCQPFSIAGVSKKNALNRPHGFLDETQGTLFFNVAQIIAHHRPKAFLLENVRNLLSHDKGRTFEVIRRSWARSCIRRMAPRRSIRLSPAAISARYRRSTPSPTSSGPTFRAMPTNTRRPVTGSGSVW